MNITFSPSVSGPTMRCSRRHRAVCCASSDGYAGGVAGERPRWAASREAPSLQDLTDRKADPKYMSEGMLNMVPRFWLIIIGASLVLSPSRSSFAQDVVGKKPVLTVRAVAVPRERLKYQYDWFRRIWSYGEVACVVTNVSKKPITITNTIVDWDVNFGTDNPCVRVVHWGASGNAAMSVVLKPGTTYSKTVPLQFDGLNEGQRVTFRVSFESNCQRVAIPSYTVWSNPVTTLSPKAKP